MFNNDKQNANCGQSKQAAQGSGSRGRSNYKLGKHHYTEPGKESRAPISQGKGAAQEKVNQSLDSSYPHSSPLTQKDHLQQGGT